MFLKKVLFAGAAMLLLAACEGGDVNINANDNSVNTDNSVSGGGGSNNPCAQYTDPDTQNVVQGAFDGSNCSYDSNFVGAGNPLTVDLTIPFITGVHIFQDSLFVGENCEDNTDCGGPPPQAPNSPTPGGVPEGTVLTIQAGAQLAWTQSSDYLLINRGSQIIADGSPTTPIIFSSFTDLVSGTVDPEAVAQWGGMVINGNGRTNKCTQAQADAQDCHITSEGQPSQFGGNNNAESSGILRYVQVKHTGFEVVDGDELNGITFNAVGSGTVVENVQAYSTSDDGLEFFGGAVNVTNFVGLYINDDSLDYADGYVGTITNALIIHGLNTGNRCIEADNQGSSGDFDAEPRAAGTVNNMTCIISAQDGSIRGDSEGPLLRRGAATVMNNSIIIDAYARVLESRDGNECSELNNQATYEQALTNTLTAFNSTINACQNPAQDDADVPAVIPGFTPTFADFADWWLNAGNNSDNVVITASDSANLVVLNGIYTAPAFADDAGVAFTVTPVAVPNGATNADGDPIIGAVSADNDWTAGWTFGLVDTANGGRLWFNPSTGAAP
ncbi:MAG: serine/threonine protein kinase [Pseudomonadota bacterium]